MGRDISVVSTHASSVNPVIRSIISSDTQIRLDAKNRPFFYQAKQDLPVPA